MKTKQKLAHKIRWSIDENDVQHIHQHGLLRLTAALRLANTLNIAMLAKLLKTEGEEGGLAVISLNGFKINAMDCLGYGSSSTAYPKIGDEFTPEFSCLFDDEATWSSLFEGNPNQEQKLEPIGLWSYRAFGRLVTIDGPQTEAKANCGGCLIPLPIIVSNEDHLGQFVAFNIARLDVWRA